MHLHTNTYTHTLQMDSYRGFLESLLHTELPVQLGLDMEGLMRQIEKTKKKAEEAMSEAEMVDQHRKALEASIARMASSTS